MTVTVDIGSPEEPAATALLQASHALMQNLFPADSNHFLSVDALCAPEIRFFIARIDGKIRGCGALAIRDGYGEIKSMFTDPEARGHGLAAIILARIETEATGQNLSALRLETGDSLHAAHRLYAKNGFTARGPFGEYDDDPHSIFMEKQL